MKKSLMYSVTSKWVAILKEYEKVKSGNKTQSTFCSVNDLCDAYHVHRKDIRKYYERWVKNGKSEESLLPHHRGPKPGKHKLLSKEEERIIVKIHRRLGSNEFEIFELLKSRWKVHPSVSTIYRTLKQYRESQSRVSKPAVKRYERRTPGELLHADTYRLSKGMMQDRTTRHLFGIIDDYTRLAYVEPLWSNTAADVTRAFFHSLRFFLAHGVRPRCVMTDNGSEFTAFTSQKAQRTHFFETMLDITGIRHIRTHPYHPQTNGKVERFWKILRYECIANLDPGQTMNTVANEVEGYLYRYNYQRRHGALGYITPFDRLSSFVTELST
jgi:transposase InsO family protein